MPARLSAPQTEQEIVAGWRREGPPLVSVVCTAYNHEPYLRDAVESFLAQRTSFPFEIILHDDASTDGTAGLIREYAERYPRIVVPVLQTENRYSKGESTTVIAFGHARGDFIALCEGDDFWTEPEKLAIQVAEMERHPECWLSFHSAFRVYEDGSGKDEVICRRFTGSAVVAAREVILWGGSYMPTASLCLRRELVAMMLHPDDTFFRRYLIDYFAQIFGSLNGGALYIDRTMSVHRCMSIGSWSSTVNSDGAALVAWADKVIEGIGEADRLTGGAFHDDFARVTSRFHCSLLSNRVISRKRRGEHYRKYRDRLGAGTRLLWLVLFRNGELVRCWELARRIYSKMRSFGLFTRKGGR